MIGVVTFLYVQFGVATTTTSVLFASTPNGQHTTNDSDELLIATISPGVIANVPTTGMDPTSMVTGDQLVSNRSDTELLSILTNRYQIDNGTVRDDDFVVGPSVSESTALSFVVKDDLTKKR